MPQWWGEFEFAASECRAWQIGPLRLVVHRDGNDWLLASNSAEAPLATALEVHQVCDAPEDDDLAKTRFAFDAPQTRLNVSLRLADRAFSVRADHPVSVPSGQAVTFFVTTPLWLRLGVGSRDILLDEIATYQPSDTWFGSPVSGELCYAARTRAKSRMGDLPRPPHRATTPVKVINKAVETLRIEQLKLPVPNLALYCDVDGNLLTPAVEFTRSAAGGAASMRLGQAPANAQRVSEPRLRLRDNRVLQVFDWVLGGNTPVSG